MAKLRAHARPLHRLSDLDPFVAVEGDWPDCQRMDRFVRGQSAAGENAPGALHAFERWPTWMWANTEFLDFVSWLRVHNAARPVAERVGFYGLDVYSLWDSLRHVLPLGRVRGSLTCVS